MDEALWACAPVPGESGVLSGRLVAGRRGACAHQRRAGVPAGDVRAVSSICELRLGVPGQAAEHPAALPAAHARPRPAGLVARRAILPAAAAEAVGAAAPRKGLCQGGRVRRPRHEGRHLPNTLGLGGQALVAGGRLPSPGCRRQRRPQQERARRRPHLARRVWQRVRSLRAAGRGALPLPRLRLRRPHRPGGVQGGLVAGRRV
mmetsp:Transcript_16115/g.50659  ORF Transcript_16115/g.50659 Transcript_16115/m.50659 type:complete len:204 (+) Transcript_16115:1377-1988(+)